FAAGRYQLASRLEFYLPGRPDVLSLNPGRDAYDDWQDLAQLRGHSFVFVASDRFPDDPRELGVCDSVRVFSRLLTAVRPPESFHTMIYVCRRLRPPNKTGT